MTDEECHSFENIRARADAFCDAYIRESPRPDCEPGFVFRVTMPSGVMSYHKTRIEAFRALMAAIGR